MLSLHCCTKSARVGSQSVDDDDDDDVVDADDVCRTSQHVAAYRVTCTLHIASLPHHTTQE